MFWKQLWCGAWRVTWVIKYGLTLAGAVAWKRWDTGYVVCEQNRK